MPDVSYRVLTACSLSCEFCSLWQQAPHQQDYLPLSDVLCDLKALAGAKVCLHLGGGDPLLYPQLADLLQQAQPWFKALWLYTPGMRYPAMAERIRPWVDELCLVLNHPLEADNDRIGGEHHFELVRASVRKAQAIGQSLRLLLLTHCESALFLPEAEELARALGVRLELRPTHVYLQNARLTSETLAYIKRYTRVPGIIVWPRELRSKKDSVTSKQCAALPGAKRSAFDHGLQHVRQSFPGWL